MKRKRNGMAIEKIHAAARKSPALRDLLDYQAAYLLAVKRASASDDHDDYMILKAAKYAVQNHCVDVAQRAGADETTLDVLRSAPIFNWHECVYFLMHRVPKIEEFIMKGEEQ